MSKLLADFLSPPIYTNLYGFVPRMDAIWTPKSLFQPTIYLELDHSKMTFLGQISALANLLGALLW